ncbi:MAG: GreA/GreB family elongation factor [Opitutales bacterium]|nr:GreA/GreB family elongation factor [Opitutales bacterium]
MTSEAIKSLIEKNAKLEGKKELLEKFADGAFCMHSSWGLGRIKNYDAAANRLIIDFEGKPGHSMDPVFCVDKLEVLDEDNVLVRNALNPKAVEAELKEAPAKFVENLLAKMPEQSATAVELENVLVRLFASEKEFRSWWNKAKKLLVRDPKVACPKTKNEYYVLREEEIKPEKELLSEYFLNRDPKKKILLAEKLFRLVDSSGDKEAIGESVKTIEDDLEKIKEELTSAIKTARSLSQADKLHGIWVRNDLVRFLYPEDEDRVEALSPRSSEIIAQTIDQDNKDGLSELAKNLPSAYYNRFLDLITRIYPDKWREMVLDLLQKSDGRFTNECVNFLVDWKGSSNYVKGEAGKLEDEKDADCKKLVEESLHRWLEEQTLRGPVILWIVKNRNAAKYKGILSSLIGQKLFTALLSAIDDEALQSDSNRRIPLVDALSDDGNLVADLLRGAPAETARDWAQSLLLNQGFDDLTQKSILARFIKIYPNVQTLVAGRGDTKAERLYVSKESLEARRAELEDIIKNQIPASKKAIEAARELGDLRENSEYKMAREHDETLSARRAQLQRDISRAEVVDFAMAPTDVVGIGSVVTLEKDGKGRETCYIRGAWDSDPDKNIYSYKTPLAQALLERRVGDVVETNIEGHKTIWKILSITV